MRMVFLRVVALILLGTMFGWCGTAECGPDGKALYEAKCMLCHGPNGNGKGPGAIALNPKPADYTKRKFWEQPDIEKKIAEITKTGKGQMQAAPDLKPEEIQAIVDYMIRTFKPK